MEYRNGEYILNEEEGGFLFMQSIRPNQEVAARRNSFFAEIDELQIEFGPFGEMTIETPEIDKPEDTQHVSIEYSDYSNFTVTVNGLILGYPSFSIGTSGRCFNEAA